MVQIETLPNGVRLVTEAMDTVRSAALGIWVGGGSREETPEESGAAHFIEHMLFKGTQRRTAQDIARETDAIGGQMNAFTTKECTCFYGRVLDDHLPQALDILFDMVYCSSFAQEAVETERGVILEEIDMYEDTPDDLCAEKLFGAVFAGSPLARPILGREETLAPMTGAFLKAYHDAHYRGDNTVVALTGSFSQEVLEDIRRRFSALPAGRAPAPVPAAYTPAFVATAKPIEQNHLTLATSMRAMRVDWLWLSTRMPSVSVRKMSLSAPIASATARAASSALQFRAPPSSLRLTGETTGRKPLSSKVRRSRGSTFVMVPTRPSALSFCRAVMRPPSRPDTPQAFAPMRSRAETMDLFTRAERAISAVSNTVSSVTR